MAVIAFPDDIRPTQAKFYLQANTALMTSTLNNATQVLQRDGTRWMCDLSFELPYKKAARLDAFLAALRGSANEVRLWDFRRDRPIAGGEVSGALSYTQFSDDTAFSDGAGFADLVASGAAYLEAAASRDANTLVTAGWGRNEEVLQAGDYLQVGDYLVMATQDVTADNLGQASFTVEPPLRADLAAGSAISTSKPGARFRLADNTQGQNQTDYNRRSTYSLSFVESLP